MLVRLIEPYLTAYLEASTDFGRDVTKFVLAQYLQDILFGMLIHVEQNFLHIAHRQQFVPKVHERAQGQTHVAVTSAQAFTAQVIDVTLQWMLTRLQHHGRVSCMEAVGPLLTILFGGLFAGTLTTGIEQGVAYPQLAPVGCSIDLGSLDGATKGEVTAVGKTNVNAPQSLAMNIEPAISGRLQFPNLGIIVLMIVSF